MSSISTAVDSTCTLIHWYKPSSIGLGSNPFQMNSVNVKNLVYNVEKAQLLSEARYTYTKIHLGT